jgi:epsilon-lactone hydrolase
VSGSRYTHRKMFGHLAKAVGARALLVDYRLLAEGGGYPAPADGVTAAYRWLLERGISAQHVALAGDSVGAWLALAVQLRNPGLPRPAAAMLLSPAVDMEVTGESFMSNRDKDPSSSGRPGKGSSAPSWATPDRVTRWSTRCTPI